MINTSYDKFIFFLFNKLVNDNKYSLFNCWVSKFTELSSNLLISKKCFNIYAPYKLRFISDEFK